MTEVNKHISINNMPIEISETSIFQSLLDNINSKEFQDNISPISNHHEKEQLNFTKDEINIPQNYLSEILSNNLTTSENKDLISENDKHSFIYINSDCEENIFTKNLNNLNEKNILQSFEEDNLFKNIEKDDLFNNDITFVNIDNENIINLPIEKLINDEIEEQEKEDNKFSLSNEIQDPLIFAYFNNNLFNLNDKNKSDHNHDLNIYENIEFLDQSNNIFEEVTTFTEENKLGNSDFSDKNESGQKNEYNNSLVLSNNIQRQNDNLDDHEFIDPSFNDNLKDTTNDIKSENNISLKAEIIPKNYEINEDNLESIIDQDFYEILDKTVNDYKLNTAKSLNEKNDKPTFSHVSQPIHQIKIASKAMLDSDLREFNINLFPADLGTVKIELIMDQDNLNSLNIYIEKPETLTIIQQDLKSLNEVFNEIGMKIAESDINLWLQNGGENKGQNEWAQENKENNMLKEKNNNMFINELILPGINQTINIIV